MTKKKQKTIMSFATGLCLIPENVYGACKKKNNGKWTGCWLQGWAVNSNPGICQWHLSVFTGLENTPQVANTGKLNFFALKYSRCL